MHLAGTSIGYHARDFRISVLPSELNARGGLAVPLCAGQDCFSDKTPAV